MIIAFGQQKISCKFGEKTIKIKMFTTGNKITYFPMVSSDGYILKDVNGLYLMVKEDNEQL